MEELFSRLFTQDVVIDGRTIYVNNIAVGILIPSITISKTEDCFLISGPKGVSRAQVDKVEDIWASLIASGAILFGVDNEPKAIEYLLSLSDISRTVSYLCNISRNCKHLLDGYRKIQHSCIAVIGVGGIGSLTATILAGSGVGKLILVDPDRIEESNLNRQFLYKRSDIGEYKVDVLARELKERFPRVDTQIFKNRVDEKFIIEELAGREDISSVVVTADEPLGLSTKFFSLFFQKLNVVNCGYVNGNASIFFVPKESD